MKSFILKQARIVDPSVKLDFIGDILVQNGIIMNIADTVEYEVDACIDVSGKWIIPGLVDVHVHLRVPGDEKSETIISGTQAALCGGVTHFFAMANTTPTIDNIHLFSTMQEKFKNDSLVNIHQICSVSRGLQGKELVDLEALSEAGCLAFSDDGQCITNSHLLYDALQKTKKLNLPIIEHAEDHSLSKNGVINEGIVSNSIGCDGILSESEASMVYRDILLAQKTGAHVHLAHVSTALSIGLLRDAKKIGIPVTAEACPHHFTLTEESIFERYQYKKMKPPLRTQKDKEAILEALADGTIDIIATDHAPHKYDATTPIQNVPFGITGLQTSWLIGYNILVKQNVLSLNNLIRRMSLIPSEIFNIPQNSIAVQKNANFFVFDPNNTFTLSHMNQSKSQNSPFWDTVYQGSIDYTVVNGILHDLRDKTK